MKRGELYRVPRSRRGDPREFRVFCIVSRQSLLGTSYEKVICAPVFSRYDGLATQVPVGLEEGMKDQCSIHCDTLRSLDKRRLTYLIGTLSPEKIELLDRALAAALDLR